MTVLGEGSSCQGFWDVFVGLKIAKVWSGSYALGPYLSLLFRYLDSGCLLSPAVTRLDFFQVSKNKTVSETIDFYFPIVLYE